MPFSNDISSDSLLFDGGETVSLRQIRPGGVAVVSVANAVGSAVTRNTAGLAAGAALCGVERCWSLSAALVGTEGIEPGDALTDAAGIVWSVLEARLVTLGSRWKCVTRRVE